MCFICRCLLKVRLNHPLLFVVVNLMVSYRYCRSRGYNSLFICGTDEYGTATEVRAHHEGLSPQEICNKYHQLHKEVYDWFGIDFDFFGRTSTPAHTEITQQIFDSIHQNNNAIIRQIDSWFCESHGSFLADRFVEGTCPSCGFADARGDQCDSCAVLIDSTQLKNARCKICGGTPVLKAENHFFLRLDSLQPEVQEFVKSSSDSWSSNASRQTSGFLQSGLRERCITRDLKWGVPVPLAGWENKVFYVWFDAPIGYISITSAYTDQWERWWKNPAGNEVNLVQFLGKDNILFHSVFFPSYLLATGQSWTLVGDISATEYLTANGDKFNKGRGVGLFGHQAQQSTIHPDVWRYYLLSIRPETSDADFSFDDLVIKNNSDLADAVGNFVNRTSKLIQSEFGGTLPDFFPSQRERDLETEVRGLLHRYCENLERQHLRDGLKIAVSLAHLGNKYIQETEPWFLAKQDRVRCGSVLSTCASILHMLAILLLPYVPFGANKILYDILGLPRSQRATLVDSFSLPLLRAGHKIQPAPILFPKIDRDEADRIKASFRKR
jgi:methionyl-tRNA synthetase